MSSAAGVIGALRVKKNMCKWQIEYPFRLFKKYSVSKRSKALIRSQLYWCFCHLWNIILPAITLNSTSAKTYDRKGRPGVRISGCNIISKYQIQLYLYILCMKLQ